MTEEARKLYLLLACMSTLIRRERSFYDVITIAILLGLTTHFIDVDLLRALAVAATVNVVLAIPLTPFITFIANGAVIIDDFNGPEIFDCLVGGTTVFPHAPLGSRNVQRVLQIGT